MLATAHNTFLGAIIALTERVLYPTYAAAPRLFGLGPLDDQALAGGIMWSRGHMYLIAVLILVHRALGSERAAPGPSGTSAGWAVGGAVEEARGYEVHGQVMDAAHLALRDASFDCVVLHLALAVVPDPVAAIQEAARVLRPGGRISIFDKFLPDGATPSRRRRAAARIAAVIATDLNRQLGPLLTAGGLGLSHAEPFGLGGLFIVARADKPGD